MTNSSPFPDIVQEFTTREELSRKDLETTENQNRVACAEAIDPHIKPIEPAIITLLTQFLTAFHVDQMPTKTVNPSNITWEVKIEQAAFIEKFRLTLRAWYKLAMVNGHLTVVSHFLELCPVLSHLENTLPYELQLVRLLHEQTGWPISYHYSNRDGHSKRKVRSLINDHRASLRKEGYYSVSYKIRYGFPGDFWQRLFHRI